MRQKPVLALTMGDPAGIGPEILVAALGDPAVRRTCRPLAVGHRDVLWRRGWRPGLAPLLDPGVACKVQAGRPTAAGGAASFAAVRLAFCLTARRLADGMVTAPISKEWWKKAGVPYPDHTDYLEAASRSGHAGMMLLSGRCRTMLVTRHLPLGEAVKRISTRAVVEASVLAHAALRQDLKIARPRMGLCALNPHAGEHGILGREERQALLPAARILRRRGLKISDPIPADSAWALAAEGRYDVLISLYHDQALIPLKVMDRFGVVNWTLGIPTIRTSPGHGTAFDIAGTRKADPKAMIASALLAASLARS